jgi:hypothetical protein
MTSSRHTDNPVIPTVTIPVTVTVYYVEQNGNSPSGEYLFFLSQDVVHVTETNTAIQYNLSTDTVARGIRFTGYFATDSHRQLSELNPLPPSPGVEILSESITLLHTNLKESLLVRVSLQVTELQARHRRCGIDPQITNVPSPH